MTYYVSNEISIISKNFWIFLIYYIFLMDKMLLILMINIYNIIFSKILFFF